MSAAVWLRVGSLLVSLVVSTTGGGLPSPSTASSSEFTMEATDPFGFTRIVLVRPEGTTQASVSLLRLSHDLLARIRTTIFPDVDTLPGWNRLRKEVG